jgi:hypothetical protein
MVVSIIVCAVGAILDRVATEPHQHSFDVNNVGWILMALASLVVSVDPCDYLWATQRRRTSVDDGPGPVMRRVDTEY